ncbi:hypothetical protein F53441_12569 [Fusarium austroafricanum]|uniref:Uncharacterized protein n=1 Tax=Fusarium austroafricanum TaxID=2364996 RepID=A0A8H4JUV4_9HYPO|nr:hypothetical protein F53441_12569 [Fusarium austroafricanum]
MLILLATQIILFSAELFSYGTQRYRWLWTPLKPRIWLKVTTGFFPLIPTLQGLFYALLMIVDLDPIYKDKGGRCLTLGVDGDLAGDGVRIATWAQVIILFIISFAGMFHPEATGVKEIGAGLVLTHLSLSIAMVVQLGQNTLSPVDAVIGCMILDAQNMALSMQLTAKETLAARWQVLIVIIVQTFGLCNVGIIMSSLFRNSLDTSQCECLTVFWWAWAGNCSPPSEEQNVFWIYYIFRILNLIQSSLHSSINTIPFHKAERKYSVPMSLYYREGQVLHITCPRFQEDGSPAYYEQYPATLTATYAFNGMFAIASMTTAELALGRLHLRPTAALSSIGQIIALVVSGTTVLRALWLFAILLRKRDALDFIWPFHTARPPIGRFFSDHDSDTATLDPNDIPLRSHIVSTSPTPLSTVVRHRYNTFPPI